MDFIEIRNSLIKKMWAHLQRPVILSDQASPETKYPYIYYNVIGPPKGLNGTGDNRIITKDNDAYTVLHDQPTATFSFTACSQNRTEDEKVILGDDEAMELSEKAIHYLEHIGYKELSLLGIVVVEISNEGQRSGLVVDEIDRRYGFDCRIRFEHTTERNDGSVENINLKKE